MSGSLQISITTISISGDGGSSGGAVAVQGAQGHRHHHGGHGQLLSDVADAVGMSRDELRQQLDSGKSIADVAQSKGVSLDQLKAKLGDALSKRLQSEVDAGRLTQEQATAFQQRAAAGLDRILTHKRDGADRGSRGFDHGVAGQPGQLLEDMATVVGMGTDDLLAQLASGKSLTEIGAERGMSQQQLKDGLLKAFQHHVQDAEASRPQPAGQDGSNGLDALMQRASAFLDRLLSQGGSLLGDGVRA